MPKDGLWGLTMAVQQDAAAGEQGCSTAMNVALLGVLCLGLYTCGGLGRTSTDDPSPARRQTVAGPLIAPDAISSYSEADRKHYPKLFARLGKRVFEVGDLGKKAALLAIKKDQCDRVIYVDVSDRSSRDDLQFFVDCANETRVRVSEAEIKAGQAVDIETKSNRMAKASANIVQYDGLVAKAKERVLASLRDPGSADFGPVTISYKNGTVACGTVNARNGFGGMSGQQLFVAFDDGITSQQDEDFVAQWEKHCG